MTTQNLPPDPMTGASEMTIMLHEFYKQCLAAGFTDIQAMSLTKQMLAESFAMHRNT